MARVTPRSHENTRDPHVRSLICVFFRYGSGTNLEEVDLHRAVAQVEHDGALCAEPVAQVGQPRELVSVTWRYVSACFQQVLTHVVPEILQQRDLKDRRRKNKTSQNGEDFSDDYRKWVSDRAAW